MNSWQSGEYKWIILRWEARKMNVRELDFGELLQLKEELYYRADICPKMTEEQKKICDEAMYVDDIPDELVFELYDGIEFVKEDFWINLPSCENDD